MTKAKTEVATIEDKPKGKVVATRVEKSHPPAPVSETMQMMQLVRDIAQNPHVDVEKMRAIIDLQRDVQRDQARFAFDEAMSRMQGELPSIRQNGTIEVRAKDNAGNRTGAIQQSTKFARWDDINAAIKPILSKFGFSLRFKTGLTSDNRVMVTGILSGHGHREESESVLPHDSTGSKNAVQAIGSSTSYGKRYAACALLNITSNGEDDDGQSSGAPVEDQKAGETKNVKDDGAFPGDKSSVKTVGDDELANLVEAIEFCGVGRAKFCKHYEIEKVSDLPASRYKEALKSCADYAARSKDKK